MEELRQLLTETLNGGLRQITLSNSRVSGFSKARLRPLKTKNGLCFQAEEFRGKQAFHKNLTAQEAREYVEAMLLSTFGQAQIQADRLLATVLSGKKGRLAIRKKRQDALPGPSQDFSHNRAKRYLLPEGTPVPFLVDLGVMTKEGTVVQARYDKFRQINRFLEFIRDILPELPQDRELTVIDFGCGKSYLTFAVYYYLHELLGLPVRIVGLDLKEDVIRRCGRLAAEYGYDGLSFTCGDIASYTGAKQADLVMTLHACDTATDDALAKAVSWNAKVILSVPCCQHELNRQISCGLLSPALDYGLIRERMAALFTDAIRGRLLEQAGYRTQLLEFIDMEHTPKNILIRAVKTGRAPSSGKELDELLRFLGVSPTLKRLLEAPERREE